MHCKTSFNLLSRFKISLYSFQLKYIDERSVMDNLKIPYENFGAKFRKKWMRSRAKLQKDAVDVCNSISRCICISNGGLGNGITREVLSEILQKYDKTECLMMPPKKSYSFASFGDLSSAENVVKNLQGFVLNSEANLASSSVTFYIHYIKEFPLGVGDVAMPKRRSCLPQGLIVIEEFITEELESELLLFLEKECPTDPSFINSNLKHRKVWHYGYEFRYKYSDVDKKKPLQEKTPSLIEKITAMLMETGNFKFIPDQVTINKYDPGQGIPPHIDNTEAFEESLGSLSLLSQTVMDFRKENEHVEMLLKPRSLMILTGDARYQWTHGICPRKVDLVEVKLGTNNSCENTTSVNRGTRFSITFRKVRSDYNGPPENSNMISPDVSSPADSTDAERLEEAYVHKVYNEIASHFTATREKPWPNVKKFIDELQADSLILDVGCGSGRYLGIRKDVCMIGCDRSESLIGICKGKGFQVFTCDGLNLPVRRAMFDACICIAVIHHYSLLERRINAVEELISSVRIGGKILIYVWALEQEYHKIKSKYLREVTSDSSHSPTTLSTSHSHDENNSYQEDSSKIRNKQKSLPVHKNRRPFQQQDVLVPWHRKNVVRSLPENKTKSEKDLSQQDVKTFHRYYHVFKQKELTDLCGSFHNITILHSYYDEGNWCVVLQRTE